MPTDITPPTMEWPLPASATLGSSVRAKGIERQLRRRLPWALRKQLTVEAGRVILSVPEGDADATNATERISEAVKVIGELPVLPSEVEDALAISSRERHKWTKDGRLRSIGTRTVKLRGRAKAVTFHVFDARDIEDVLDGELPTIWREEDARTAAENRRRAAGKAALARTRKISPKTESAGMRLDDSPNLAGWEEFDADGLLR